MLGSDLNPLIVNHIAPGVVQERSANGRLVIFAVSDGSTSTITAWAKAVHETLNQWPAGQPCYLLHDLHRSGVAAFNAHMQEGFKMLYTLRNDIKQYVAFVMPSHGVEEARLDNELRTLNERRAGEHFMHWSIFLDRQEALHWLAQHMQTEHEGNRT